MRAVLVVIAVPASPHVEDADVRGGAARRGRVHAELLPEGAARARAARVRALRAPPHQDQGTSARGVTALFPCTAAELPLRLPQHLFLSRLLLEMAVIPTHGCF